jgi:hypothetical protein
MGFEIVKNFSTVKTYFLNCLDRDHVQTKQDKTSMPSLNLG